MGMLNNRGGLKIEGDRLFKMYQGSLSINVSRTRRRRVTCSFERRPLRAPLVPAGAYTRTGSCAPSTPRFFVFENLLYVA